MAKTATYSLIESQTLGSAQATVTFSSVPSGYTDLILVIAGTASNNNLLALRFNSDTGSNYSSTNITGDGTSASSARTTTAFAGTIYRTSLTQIIFQIQDYSNATTYKTGLYRSNLASANVEAGVGLWRSTSAINAITVYLMNTGNLAAGSTFKLYGIQAGNA